MQLKFITFMRMLESKINKILGTFGLEMKRTRHNPSLQTLLRRFFDQQKVDCVLDVGANVGGYGQFLRHVVGYKGLIISFEPVSSVYRNLQKCASQYAKWHTYQMALGSKNSTLTIHVAKESVFSSFLTPCHGLIEDNKGQNEIVAEEAVPVNRLDSIFQELQAQYGFRRPYLKMDTQGFDQEVLAGAHDIMHKLIGLQSEISFLPIYVNMPKVDEMYTLISHLGFDLIGMFPVNLDRDMRWIEADAVFITRNFNGIK